MKAKLKFVLKALLGVCFLIAVIVWGYVHSLDLDSEPQSNPASTAADLAFVRDGISIKRGRILAVLTSTASFDDGQREAGYELTELSRAYWVFVANGYEVDFASPLGGSPPQVLDENLLDEDYAFLNDPKAKMKLANTVALAKVEPSNYAAVYFVGGKGAMFDFPNNVDIARIVRNIHPRGAIGAVCHGPAALLGVTLDNGQPLLQGRQVTGFSNAEELFLIKNARKVFPSLLQDALAKQAGNFVSGPMYLDNTVVDGRIITGQNPWSTWSVAEGIVRALGHEPVPRQPTAEENAVRILETFHSEGLESALLLKAELPRASKRMLLMYSIIATIQFRIGDAWDLQKLARS